MADSDRPLYKILSTKTIWWAAAIIALTGAAATTWLLLAFGYHLEAIKTASTVFLGTGAAAALLLAARRQRSTEIALNQTDRDATERRITELYTKAADQLGSDKAPVRLAGLYALERVAQNNPDQRQTIVNVLCAYLRMPYKPPADADDHEQVQEREVRLTAQRLLTDHLRPYEASTFWANINLDLTGATLIDFNLSLCTVTIARFGRATFVGRASFNRTTFADHADFFGATFTAGATFTSTMFNTTAFDAASFAGTADFSRAHFSGTVLFSAVAFRSDAFFSGAVFDAGAIFGKRFLGRNAASFDKAVFFGAATFNGQADFTEVSFGEDARFASPSADERTAFNQDVSFESAVFGGIADFDLVNFNSTASFRSATFARGVPESIAPEANSAGG